MEKDEGIYKPPESLLTKQARKVKYPAGFGSAAFWLSLVNFYLMEAEISYGFGSLLPGLLSSFLVSLSLMVFIHLFSAAISMLSLFSRNTTYWSVFFHTLRTFYCLVLIAVIALITMELFEFMSKNA